MKNILRIAFTLSMFLFAGQIVSAQVTTPANLIATSTAATTVHLNWATSTDAVGYQVFRNATTTALGTVSSGVYDDSGLSTSTKYTYFVRAYNASSTYSDFASTEITTPSGATIVSPATTTPPVATTTPPVATTTVQTVNAYIMNVGKNKSKAINVKSNEIIKIVVLASADLNANDIIEISATFGGARTIFVQKRDVNRDGKMDKIFYFRAKAMIDLANTDKTAVFRAKLKNSSIIIKELAVSVKNGLKKKKVEVKQKIQDKKQIKAAAPIKLQAGPVKKVEKVEAKQAEKKKEAEKNETKKSMKNGKQGNGNNGKKK